MKKSKFTAQQIAVALKHAETRTPFDDGKVSSQGWAPKSFDVRSNLKKNERPKSLFVNLSVDKYPLQDVLSRRL